MVVPNRTPNKGVPKFPINHNANKACKAQRFHMAGERDEQYCNSPTAVGMEGGILKVAQGCL